MTLTAQQALAMSVAEAWERARFDFEDEQRELQRWYESGKQLTFGVGGDLLRKEAEAEEDWQQRVARMATVNVLARIVDNVAGWIYKQSPKRMLSPKAGDDTTAEETLQDQLRRMRMRIVERNRGAANVLLGKAWDTYGWRPSYGKGDTGSVTVRSVPRSDIFAEYDPLDPYRLTLVIYRFAIEGGEKLKSPYRYVKWTDATYESFDGDFRPLPLGDLPPSGPNPYRLIPFSECRGLTVPGTERCISLVRDVIPQMRVVLNELSDLGQLIRYQSGDVMVLKDFPGEEKSKTTGASRFIRLNPDPATDLFFASPDAKIQDVLAVVMKRIEWCFQQCAMPVTVFTGDQAESGYALMVRYQTALSLVQDYQERMGPGEEHALRVICAVGRYGKLALPEPWSIDPMVTFSGDIFPADEDARRLADGRDVDAGRMSLEDYLRRNRKDIPEDQVEEHAAKLEAKQSAKDAAAASAFAFAGPPDPGAAL